LVVGVLHLISAVLGFGEFIMQFVVPETQKKYSASYDWKEKNKMTSIYHLIIFRLWALLLVASVLWRLV